MPWTPIIGHDVAALDYVNELRLAVWERATACGAASIAAKYGGSAFVPLDQSYAYDVAHRALWRGMQDDIDAIVATGVWANHSLGDPAGQAGITAMDVDAFRTVAGIPSGWRRANTWPASWAIYTDPAYVYGNVTILWLFGPWIIADLQAALSALQWTVRNDAVAVDRWRLGLSATGSSEQEVREQLTTGWPPDGGWQAGGAFDYCARCSILGGRRDFWSGEVERMRSRFELSAIPTAVPCSCDVYVAPSPIPGGRYATSFADLDAYGLQSGALWHMSSLPASQDATRVTPYLGLPGDGSPSLVDQITPKPDWWDHNAWDWWSSAGLRVNGSSWLLKWQFSNP